MSDLNKQTKDQVAAVMLLHGSPSQQAEAAKYMCSLVPWASAAKSTTSKGTTAIRIAAACKGSDGVLDPQAFANLVVVECFQAAMIEARGHMNPVALMTGMMERLGLNE